MMRKIFYCGGISSAPPTGAWKNGRNVADENLEYIFLQRGSVFDSNLTVYAFLRIEWPWQNKVTTLVTIWIASTFLLQLQPYLPPWMRNIVLVNFIQATDYTAKLVMDRVSCIEHTDKYQGWLWRVSKGLQDPLNSGRNWRTNQARGWWYVSIWTQKGYPMPWTHRQPVGCLF